VFKPLICYIGLRYTRPKQKNRFISFTAIASILGITVGVATLITVLSVFNGFDYQIRHKIFHLAPQILISTTDNTLSHWPDLMKKVASTPHVTGAAPYVDGQGMLTRGKITRPTMVRGIDVHLQKQVSDLSMKMQSGSFDQLLPGKFNVVLGWGLALQLNAQPGSTLNLFTPNFTISPFGVWPQIKQLKVVGIFNAGGQMGLDNAVAFVNLKDAQALYHMNQKVSGLRLAVDNLYIAPKVTAQLNQQLDWPYQVSDWTQRYQSFFKAVAMQKTMMFLILTLIIAVAVFNLLSTMIMLVNDKRADIAILKTLGATPGTIMATFVVQGTLIGLLGTLIGTISGIALALNVSKLVSLLQQWLHVQFISSAVYFIDYLPSQLHTQDIVQISSIAMIMSLLATIYPSWQAAKVQPAEALKYE
jgi:lipoprotein-releasing system permease protein